MVNVMEGDALLYGINGPGYISDRNGNKVITFCDPWRAPTDVLEEVITFRDPQRVPTDILDVLISCKFT